MNAIEIIEGKLANAVKELRRLSLIHNDAVERERIARDNLVKANVVAEAFSLAKAALTEAEADDE